VTFHKTGITFRSVLRFGSNFYRSLATKSCTYDSPTLSVSPFSKKFKKNQEEKEKNSFTRFEGFLKKFQNFPRPQYTFVSGDFSCASIFGDLSSVVKNLAKDQLVCWYPFGSARF
jgi:hypothetical protein